MFKISEQKCRLCYKEFGTQEALNQHIKDKHADAPKQESKRLKKKVTRSIIIGAILFVAIALVFWIYTSNKAPGRYDTFAKCLTEKNATMYGTQWCKFCQSQKAMFGKSFQYIDYVDCDKSQDECIKEGIKGYPAWEINGKYYSGVQQLERLSSITGCAMG